uniref:Uncharacterized protein n=1 Tax=Timema shepardi TaxID=629360 RepID=A0A7R9AW29_TIMSH|nr:unnamed protein product [Timema shepardi]
MAKGELVHFYRLGFQSPGFNWQLSIHPTLVRINVETNDHLAITCESITGIDIFLVIMEIAKVPTTYFPFDTGEDESSNKTFQEATAMPRMRTGIGWQLEMVLLLVSALSTLGSVVAIKPDFPAYLRRNLSLWSM